MSCTTYEELKELGVPEWSTMRLGMVRFIQQMPPYGFIDPEHLDFFLAVLEYGHGKRHQCAGRPVDGNRHQR